MTSLHPTQRATEDDREDPAERAVHDAFEAVRRLFEVLPPQDAHWNATVAIIAADREFRKRQANG